MQIHKLKSSFQLIGAKRCEAVVDLLSQNNNNLKYDLAVIYLLENEWDQLMIIVQKMLQEKKIQHKATSWASVMDNYLFNIIITKSNQSR